MPGFPRQVVPGAVMVSNGNGGGSSLPGAVFDPATGCLTLTEATAVQPDQASIRTKRTFVGTNVAMFDFRPTWQPPAANSNQARALSGVFTIDATNGNQTAALNAPNGIARFSGSVSAGNVTALTGTTVQLANTGSGTVTNLAGYHVQAPTNTGGGTVTNCYGMRIEGQNVGTNRYGVDIASISGGTLNYAIKTGTGLVEFGDTTTAPTVYGTGATNYTTTGTSSNITPSSVFRYNGSGAATLQGFSGGATGRTIYIYNAQSSQTLTLEHNNATESAANRAIICPAGVNLAIVGLGGVLLTYDNSQWRVVASTASTSSTVVHVEASDTAGQALTVDVTDAQFNTEAEDTHSAWSGTVFTAPMSGVYVFSTTITASYSGDLTLAYWVNGSKYWRGNSAYVTGGAHTAVMVVRLASSDTVKVRGVSVNCTRTTTASENRIHISRISD